jgi:hypothetical protein
MSPDSDSVCVIPQVVLLTFLRRVLSVPFRCVRQAIGRLHMSRRRLLTNQAALVPPPRFACGRPQRPDSDFGGQLHARVPLFELLWLRRARSHASFSARGGGYRSRCHCFLRYRGSSGVLPRLYDKSPVGPQEGTRNHQRRNQKRIRASAVNGLVELGPSHGRNFYTN